MSGPWAVASAFGKPGGGGVCPGENPRASGPPVRMCFGGYSQECCKARSKAYLKTQMRAGGRGFKKKPSRSLRVYCGEEARRLWTHPRATRACRLQTSASLATGWRCCRAFGCTSARVWSASLELGMETRGGWGLRGISDEF